MPVHDGTQPACCVCLEEVDYRGTALLACARCGINVHVNCYGVSVRSDAAAWLCEPCQELQLSGADGPGARVPPFCALCPVEGGALRRTTQPGVWCHVLCMQWIPELSHSLRGVLDEALDLSCLDPSRESLKCLVCGLRGGCIQCVSGRCARSFHVLCALRAPSDVIFTGYNNDNQQVYHCKTHLGDIATFKYEMVDDSWRRNERLAAVLQRATDAKGKCRVCGNKIPSAHQAKHEAQCMIAWITKDDAKRRQRAIERAGVRPPAIAYTAAKQSTPQPSSAKDGGGTPSKQRRQSGGMRACPQCGEDVRETLMMGHMKNRCRQRRETQGRNKHTGKAVAARQAQETVNLTARKEDQQSLDLSDVLFATWPGQSAGSLLDSTNFWRIVGNHCFNSKLLLKKRMDALCKTLCGANLADIGNFGRVQPSQEAVNCSDVVLFDRDASDGALSVKSVVHRCDFMMRSSRSRCMDDYSSKLVLRIGCNAAATCDGAKERDVHVTFKGASGSTVSCRYGMQIRRPKVEETPRGGDDGVWCRFHHDAVSVLAGAGLEALKTTANGSEDLWLALRSMDERAPVIDLTDTRAKEEPVDELTPELGLLLDKLREQVRQNRYRMRSLCRRAQLRDHYDGVFQRHMTVTEAYYVEFDLWKALSRCLLVGFKEFWRVAPDDSAEQAGESKPQGGDAETEAEPVDDGTCVVCFDGQSPESNPIIFCDRCDLAVHQRCYGVQRVPSNEFYCDRCRPDETHDPAAEVYCQLCPLRDGAFKRTIDGKWVHVVCALWCPGVWIGNLQTLSEIQLVMNSAHRTRFADTTAELAQLIEGSKEGAKDTGGALLGPRLETGLLCQYCRVACGRTLQCCHPGCTVSYHPLCGWFEGLPLTVSLSEHGFIYSGGGAGLQFKMLCASHLPEDYSEELRLTQRRRRRRFRIDSFFASRGKRQDVGKDITSSRAVAHERKPDDDEFGGSDQELCGACFELPSPLVDALSDPAALNKRQVMIRCQYCNTFVHPACCIGEVDEVSELFRSNWICERCTQVRDKPAALECTHCGRASEYMMPCHADASDASSSGHGSSSSQDQQLSRAPSTHDMATTSSTANGDKWIHVFCAKMIKARIVRKHHMLIAHVSAAEAESVGKCGICSTKGRNLVACATCQKRFHPTCAARKKYLICRSKNDWKFFCATHPPPDAAFDERRQSWITAETLLHLQELRHVLERGRMIVEMARQRDRQKKRLLNLCIMRQMEASLEMISKKRGTGVIKETYEQLTGETWQDVPKRVAPAPSRRGSDKKRPVGRSTARLNNGAESPSGPELRETSTPRRGSARSPRQQEKALKREHGEDSDDARTPSKRRRTSRTEETSSRRSSRRSLADAMEDSDDDDSTEDAASLNPRRRSSRQKSDRDEAPPRRASPRGQQHAAFDGAELTSQLLEVTSFSDFDDVLPRFCPELLPG
ncbi:hypothetical protein ATCC90586_007871 [Pythium insidiosum]|nr:hypothetical protein ATCC90586_007871 [Pythium insidiosum]